MPKEHSALHRAELVNKLQRHPSSGRDDIKVLLRVLRDEIGRAYFKRYIRFLCEAAAA